jgi:arylsulfatase A-like enzyme/Tfp pilus assembly protein PilF
MRRLLLPALAVLAVLAACGRDGGPDGAAPSPSPSSTMLPADSGPPLPAASPVTEGADIVLVTIDTLRADSLGFAGNTRVSTPVLDRLARAGRVYTDAHAHNVVTLPSHANILTGLYPFQHGIRDNSGFVLPASVPTLATWLKQAGYRTGAFVAAYPLDSRFGLDRGFDVYDDSYPQGSNPAEFVVAERRGDEVVAAARAWWDGQKGQRRFLWVHLYDPHADYAPPEPFASRFRDEPYLGEVAATDSYLAPLLGPFLDGKERPALVIVTADHGEALGDHGELTHGLFAYEATLKVPLVLWGAGVQKGTDGRAARHVDLAPTVLALLGRKAPDGLPGRPLLAAAPPAAETTGYFEALSTHLNRGWAPLRGVLRERRKYIELPVPELYDLPKDPGEKDNRVEEERRTVRALQAALPEESVWPPKKGAVSAEEEARLRALGYTAGSAPVKETYTAADDPKNLVGLDHQLHQVVDAYSRGRYPEAVALARQAIATRPDLPEAYEHAALALRQMERHEEAVALLREGLARGADRESLRRQLGLALSEAGYAAEAAEVLGPLAAEGDPATVNAYGAALSEGGRPAEAVAVLEKLAASDPDNPATFENLGVAELRRQRPAAARDRLRRALELNSNLPISWNTLGVALYQLGDPAGALDAWERAAALDPRQYDALYNLGLVAAEAGRHDQASRALRRFIATAPPARFGPDIQKAQGILRSLGG